MTQTLEAPGLAEPMLPRPFRVVARELETPDTVTLTLEDIEGAPLTFAPGQFMMIYVFGVGEVPISIAGSPRDNHQIEHTIRGLVRSPTLYVACSRETSSGCAALMGPRGPWTKPQAKTC